MDTLTGDDRVRGLPLGAWLDTAGPRKRKWKRWVFGLPAALASPFVVLARLSSALYLDKGLNGWLAVAISAAVAALLFAAIVAVVATVLGARPGTWMLKGAVAIMAVYAVYLLVYVSAANVKSDALRETYTALHPVLRVSVSTLILLDRDAVITDTSRRPEDYGRMGIAANSASLHYRQTDRYAHAVDLRTRGRSPGRNILTRLYFEAMGFDTLRHVGTADHLHVSLPVP